MSNIYIHKDGKQLGPFTEQQLNEEITQGRFSLSDMAWKEGLSDWLPIGSLIGGLPPPVPPSFTPPHVPIVGAVVAPPSTSEHSPVTCPLCGSGKHMAKAKPLYGHMVCKKCYYSFANQRQLAYFLDLLIYYAICFIVGLLLGVLMAASGSSKSDFENVASLLGWILLPFLICKDCFSGQSVGKAMCGVKVIDETTGEPGGIGASFKRNLPLVIPFMPLFVAFQLSKGHRTGDGWSNTKVIWKKYASHPIFGPNLIRK